MPSTRKQSRNRKGQAAAERGVRDVQARGGLFVEAVEATRMPMVVTDPRVADNPIIYANAAFLGLCGYERDEVLGQNYFFLTGPDTDPEVEKQVRAAMTAEREVAADVLFQTKDGRMIWVAALVTPMFEGNRVVRHFASFMDITDRVQREHELREVKESLERRVEERTKALRDTNTRLEEEARRREQTEVELREALAQGQEELRFREFLLRELNHRTKNALQLAVSLLGVQAHQTADPTCRHSLEAAMGRLRRVGEVHALLTYQPGAAAGIDAGDYLRRLCREMEAGLTPSSGQVLVEVGAEDARWVPDLVVPLGLIVGEALTNALKYAFPDGRRGRVQVSLGTTGGRHMLRIEDDGVGLPAKRREGSLGLRLVEALAKQVKGTAAIEAGHGGIGTAVVVVFPGQDASSAPQDRM